MQATIVVAFDERRGIGKDNLIPWKLPEDIRFFKELTTGHPCIMGRKTWESIPPRFRPLPNRMNIVVSRSYRADENKFFDSFLPSDAAQIWTTYTLREAIVLAKITQPGIEPFIIGGAQIYQAALSEGLVGKIYASEVFGSYDCDTFFPKINPSEWSCQLLEQHEKFNLLEFKKI